ncbi:hypothetical protein AAG906_024601 [Vitis piasezkii]
MLVPRNIQEAFDDPNWKVVVMKEMNALERSGTWELVDLPKEKRTVGCMWVFTVKCKADGNIELYKVRLVAKGFTQNYDIKKNAFLNGDMEKEVFINLPLGFEEKLGSNKSQTDHTMFYKHNKDGKIAILIVYVDDIVLTGNDKEELERLKRRLATEFEIKDLGALKYFLGMEFACSKEGIFVEAFINADWAKSVVDRRSTSGYYTFFGGNLVTCTLPMKLYCDNKATILIAHNPVFHDRTKHVEVDKCFIKEKLENGLICMSYIPTTEQVVDVLTKGIPTK